MKNGKNILIFSDGTGQVGGLMPDETRSNIYKLFRATRCGPDSAVDPSLQAAFYDPGLGSQTDGEKLKLSVSRRIRNMVSSGTGLGITENIIDCYAAIISLWRPGDRVYLFGFSRGAYTIRCVAGVMAMCGIPTQMPDGKPIRYDPKSVRALAAEAVKEVYQLGASIEGDPFKEIRERRMLKFRTDYAAGNASHANQYPYFIGVFDSVAALGITPRVRVALALMGFLGLVGVGALAAWPLAGSWTEFRAWWGLFVGVPVGLALASYLWTHLRYHPDKKRFYLTDWSMRFYDNKLDRRVGYARHALSIDEARADFKRVSWKYDGDDKDRTDAEPELLRQVWFAGNHSDIGGSYVENESRLSDNSLSWMIEQLNELPHPVQIDPAVLRVFPAANGPQHDECKKGFPGIWGKMGFKWPVEARKMPEDAPLHKSVIERFESGPVLHYDLEEEYRPEVLRNHSAVKHYYSAEPSEIVSGDVGCDTTLIDAPSGSAKAI